MAKCKAKTGSAVKGLVFLRATQEDKDVLIFCARHRLKRARL